jgi:putative transposase
LNVVSSVPPQQALRRFDNAFRAFFEERAKYPAFRRRQRRQAATDARSAFRWDAEPRTLTLAKLDAPQDIRRSRSFTGPPSTTTVSKESVRRFSVSFLLEEDIQTLPVVQTRIVVDLGPKRLVVFRAGEQIANPQHVRRNERRLALPRWNLARKQKGSKNRDRARLKVARSYAKVADQRSDGLCKLTSGLICKNQVICVESLAVKNMVGNHSRDRAKSGAGWAELVRQVECEANWCGRTLVRIDRCYRTSQRRQRRGYSNEAFTLDVRERSCPNCGVRRDRDLNAAKDILAVGRMVNAGGETVRSRRAPPDVACPDEAGISRL